MYSLVHLQKSSIAFCSVEHLVSCVYSLYWVGCSVSVWLFVYKSNSLERLLFWTTTPLNSSSTEFPSSMATLHCQCMRTQKDTQVQYCHKMLRVLCAINSIPTWNGRVSKVCEDVFYQCHLPMGLHSWAGLPSPSLTFYPLLLQGTHDACCFSCLP